MIETFQQWFREIRDAAIEDKKMRARAAHGDESCWRQQPWRSPDKNRDIKRRFAEEGLRRGYRPRPSHLDARHGEWLYDVTWQRLDPEGFLLGIELAMEIEVSDAAPVAIRHDFAKLLQTDAPYRIQVFQQRDRPATEALLDYLDDAAARYQTRRDSSAALLLCGWCSRDNDFHFRSLDLQTRP